MDYKNDHRCTKITVSEKVPFVAFNEIVQTNLNHVCSGTLFIYSTATVVVSDSTRNSRGHPKYPSPSERTFSVKKSAITQWYNVSPNVIGQNVHQACQLTNQLLRNKTQGTFGLARFLAHVMQSRGLVLTTKGCPTIIR